MCYAKPRISSAEKMDNLFACEKLSMAYIEGPNFQRIGL